MPFMDIPTPFAVIWLLWIAQAVWSCFNVWNFSHRASRLQRRSDMRVKRLGVYTPRAAVIVPVKGVGDHFADHVLALCGQDYPEYRVVFVVQAEDDPAYAALHALQSGFPREVDVLVAGLADRGGQKVHNQLRAMRSLRETDEVVVFADADAVPHNQWLRQLIEPLRHEEVGATTGYRWLVPVEESQKSKVESQKSGGGDLRPSTFDFRLAPSCFASVINASVACLLGPPRRNHAWGGSMALTRKMIDESRLLEHWDGALSDDYQLTRAVKATGKRIFFVPRCLVVSPARFTWDSLLEFSRRQYLITRIHVPFFWLLALLFTLLYTAGYMSVLVAAIMEVRGWAWGFAAWGVVFAFDFLRAVMRRRAVKKWIGSDVAERLRPVWQLERWGTPAWMTVHLLLILRSAVGRRIIWAGITYDMHSRQDVRIVRR